MRGGRVLLGWGETAASVHCTGHRVVKGLREQRSCRESHESWSRGRTGAGSVASADLGLHGTGSEHL